MPLSDFSLLSRQFTFCLELTKVPERLRSLWLSRAMRRWYPFKEGRT
jgi:hypothetical protein